ncbi:uncharacterized protein [Hetaerina americana]|uniref:uncharacterized protein n=1 Tax=Hetaerina americana TaxID=62018 RepID=UPI003A7F347D
MKGIKCHICLLGMLVWVAYGMKHLGEVPVDITAGALFRTLPDVTVYETSYPLVWKIPFSPRRELENFGLYASSCARESHPGICEAIHASLALALNNWNPRYWADPLTEAPLTSDGGAFSSSFILPMRRHAERVVISEAEAEEVEARMDNLGDLLTLPAQSMAIPEHGAIPGGSGWGVLAYLQSIIASQTGVLRACQARRLSPELINLPTLKERLQAVRRTIGTTDYDLAIRHFSRYYILPLLDCLLSPTHLYLILLVPLHKKMHSVTLRTFLPIPFARGEDTCLMRMNPLHLAVIHTRGGMSLKVLACNIYTDELCMLADPLGDTLGTIKCAEAMVKGATAKEMTASCPIACGRSPDSIVTKISSGVYVITHPPRNSTIFCGDRINATLAENFKIGAYKLTIPCACRLKLGTSTFSSQYPCESKDAKVKVHRVIPAAWAPITSLKLPPYDDRNFAVCTNLTECLHVARMTAPTMTNINQATFLYLTCTGTIALFSSLIIFSYCLYQCVWCIKDSYFQTVERPWERTRQESTQLQVGDCGPTVHFRKPPETRAPIPPPNSRIPKVALPTLYENVDGSDGLVEDQYLAMQPIDIRRDT